MQDHGIPEQRLANEVVRRIGAAQRHPAGGHQRLPLPAQGRRLRPRRAALHRHPEDLLRPGPPEVRLGQLLHEDRPRRCTRSSPTTTRRSRTPWRSPRSCNLVIPTGTYQLPEFPVPAGYTLQSYFDEVAARGAGGAAGRAAPPPRAGARPPRRRGLPAAARATRSQVISKMGFPGYFLIVWDFIRYAREQRHPGGPGPRLGGRLAGRLRAAHHRRRSAAVRPALRALPEPRPHQHARHRHRLLHAPPRRGDRLRQREVRPRPAWRRSSPSARWPPRPAIRDVGRVHGHALRRGRPDRQADPAT